HRKRRRSDRHRHRSGARCRVRFPGGMMRKLFLVLFGAITVALALATPAHAANHYSATWCDSKSGGNVVICTKFAWHDQADGTGVHVDGVYVDINNDCDKLEGDHPINEMTISMYTDDNNSIKDLQNVDQMNDCHAFRTLDLRGPDTGPAKVQWQGKVRVDNG